jgi:AcrR family transcriptional regulator
MMMDRETEPPLSRKSAAPATRAYDPENTRRDTLDAATDEFARNGLSGSRIDEIAARTKTSKRMIYYYFVDKEGLYACGSGGGLSQDPRDRGGPRPRATAARRSAQEARRLHLRLSERQRGFHPFAMIENIHHGRYLDKSQIIQKLNVTAIDAVKRLYTRGVEEGLFRKGLDPIDIHWAISALCFFNVSNRATFSRIFKRDMASASALATRRRHAIDMIVRYLAR